MYDKKDIGFTDSCITDEPAEKSFWYVLLVLNLIRITHNIIRMKLTKFYF